MKNRNNYRHYLLKNKKRNYKVAKGMLVATMGVTLMTPNFISQELGIYHNASAELKVNNPNPIPLAPTKTGTRTIEFDVKASESTNVQTNKRKILVFLDRSGSFQDDLGQNYINTIANSLVDSLNDGDEMAIYGSMDTSRLGARPGSAILLVSNYQPLTSDKDKLKQAIANKELITVDNFPILRQDPTIAEALGNGGDPSIMTFITLADNTAFDPFGQTEILQKIKQFKQSGGQVLSYIPTIAGGSKDSQKGLTLSGVDVIKEVAYKTDDPNIVAKEIVDSVSEKTITKTVSKPKVDLSVNPNGLSLKNARLTGSNGKEISLSDNNGSLGYNGELEDGKYTLTYDFGGVGDVTGTVSLDGKEVAKEKDVLGENHTVSFKVVDENGKQIGETYPIAIGGNGTNYSMIAPTVDGYTLEIQDGDSLTGTINGDKTITFVAKPNIVKSTKTEEIPFETEIIQDDTLLKGERVVKQEGVKGEYLISLENDVEVKREVTKEPIKEIIAEGTKEIGAKVVANYVTVDGKELQESKVISDENNLFVGVSYEAKADTLITDKDGLVWSLTKAPENQVGTVQKDEQQVNFVYDKVLGKDVIAKYVTEDGVELKPSIKANIDNQVGSKWEFKEMNENIIVDDKGLSWKLKEVKGDLSGVIDENEKEITYVYKKYLVPVTVKTIYKEQGSQDIIETKEVATVQVGDKFEYKPDEVVTKDGKKYDLQSSSSLLIVSNEQEKNVLEVTYLHTKEEVKTVKATPTQKALPNTGLSNGIYGVIVGGVLMIIAGIGAFIFRRKKLK